MLWVYLRDTAAIAIVPTAAAPIEMQIHAKICKLQMKEKHRKTENLISFQTIAPCSI